MGVQRESEVLFGGASCLEHASKPVSPKPSTFLQIGWVVAKKRDEAVLRAQLTWGCFVVLSC